MLQQLHRSLSGDVHFDRMVGWKASFSLARWTEEELSLILHAHQEHTPCFQSCHVSRNYTLRAKQADAPRGDKSVTIGRYVREISVKARNMLGRPQPGVVGTSRRQPTSIHTSHEPDARQNHMWGARDVVSALLLRTDACIMCVSKYSQG